MSPKLLQEELVEDDPSGWRMLVGCMLLNLCKSDRVRTVLPDLFGWYPDPEAMSEADMPTLEAILRPLGLQRQRASRLQQMSDGWLHLHTSHPVWFNIEPLAGVGKYAVDSWRIFMEGTRVFAVPPKDKVLLEFLYPKPGWPRPWIKYTYDYPIVTELMPQPWVNVKKKLLDFRPGAFQAARDRMCAVCGEKVKGPIIYGRFGESDDQTNGPGCHPRCFMLAISTCPHLRKKPDETIAFAHWGEGHGLVFDNETAEHHVREPRPISSEGVRELV